MPGIGRVKKLVTALRLRRRLRNKKNPELCLEVLCSFKKYPEILAKELSRDPNTIFKIQRIM